MKAIPPIAITDAKLTSSTIPELAPAIWGSGTTYIIGDEVSVNGAAGLKSVYRSLVNDNTNNSPASNPSFWQYRGDVYQEYSGAITYGLGDIAQNSTTHLVYESLAAGNIGNALTDTAKWLELGYTNKWAMFDLLRSSKSVTPINQTVVLNVGQRVDSIALLGLDATEVLIQVSDGLSTIYSSTINLNTRNSKGWYSYFFGAFSKKTSAIKLDLPPLSVATITVTISNTQGSVKSGAIVVGKYVYIGDVQQGAENDVLNFSTVTRDFAGGVNVMIQRRNVPKVVCNLLLHNNYVNNVIAFRDSQKDNNGNAAPAVWSGIEDTSHPLFQSLVILGFYRRFSINAAYFEHSIISLELEEI